MCYTNTTFSWSLKQNPTLTSARRGPPGPTGAQAHGSLASGWSKTPRGAGRYTKGTPQMLFLTNTKNQGLHFAAVGKPFQCAANRANERAATSCLWSCEPMASGSDGKRRAGFAELPDHRTPVKKNCLRVWRVSKSPDLKQQRRFQQQITLASKHGGVRLRLWTDPKTRAQTFCAGLGKTS